MKTSVRERLDKICKLTGIPRLASMVAIIGKGAGITGLLFIIGFILILIGLFSCEPVPDAPYGRRERQSNYYIENDSIK